MPDEIPAAPIQASIPAFTQSGTGIVLICPPFADEIGNHPVLFYLLQVFHAQPS